MQWWEYVILFGSAFVGLGLSCVFKDQFIMISTAANGALSVAIGVGVLAGIVNLGNSGVKVGAWYWVAGILMIVVIFSGGLYVQCKYLKKDEEGDDEWNPVEEGDDQVEKSPKDGEGTDKPKEGKSVKDEPIEEEMPINDEPNNNNNVDVK